MLTSHLLMIRPVNFAYNAQTAVNNAFQVRSDGSDIQSKALQEFDNFVDKLRTAGIDVTVVEDTPEPHTPDSIFPNNWISFHDDGTVVLYPMFAANRRLERKPAVTSQLNKLFNISRTIDLTPYENDGLFLEGTGSMVLDREYKLAYACLSPRTEPKLLQEFCNKMNYRAVAFTATDQNHRLIYHTNVMMCVGDKYVVICLESIRDRAEQKMVKQTIASTGKEEINISLDQMNHFAGNMLQVQNASGEKFLVMSTQAYESLTKEQVAQLERYNRILHSSLNTIESNGGGSARCMMAEIFLQTNQLK